MYDECKRKPHAPTAGWKAIYWPISLTYIAEIQTSSFWSTYIRKYGGSLAKIYPRIRGSYKGFQGSGSIIIEADKTPEVKMNFPGLRPRDSDVVTDMYKGNRFEYAKATAYRVRKRLQEEAANLKVTRKWMDRPLHLRRVAEWKAKRRRERAAYDARYKKMPAI